MRLFATVEALSEKYNLTAEQERVAESYLKDATTTITEMLAQHGKSPEDIEPDILELVTRDCAYRALSSAVQAREISQMTTSAIGYSETFTFASQSSDIYLSKKEKKLLGLTGSRLFMISPYKHDCVGGKDADW